MDVEVNFVENSNQVLLVGYSADVEVITDQREQVLRIPTQAIRQRNKVWALGPQDRLEERTLEIGLSNWAYTEIISGLQAGDQVLIATDIETIVPGIQVKPKGPPS